MAEAKSSFWESLFSFVGSLVPLVATYFVAKEKTKRKALEQEIVELKETEEKFYSARKEILDVVKKVENIQDGINRIPAADVVRIMQNIPERIKPLS